MVIVGLTGGIGSGKSTVSAALAERGAVVIDADAITHSLQRRGTDVFNAIVAEFGEACVGGDGELDRAALAEQVFTDADAKARLEAIVHPAVGAEIVRQLAEAVEQASIIVLDVPLLVESNRSDELLDGMGLQRSGLVVVDTSPAVALGRLVEQRGMDVADAEARMANQASRDERLARADFVIDNNGTRDELEHHIAACWDWLESLAG